MLKIFSKKRSKNEPEDLALDLNPGDKHYRAFVGPPQDYDLISAMSFNLLTCAGLRQHHKVLDIGCGSLRIGRLLIPYLNQGNYTGVEPNKWLVEDGIKREIGQDQINIKKPKFIFSDSIKELDINNIDFAIAQSIFSHTGKDLMDQWLNEISHTLSAKGCLFATVVISDTDTEADGWVYPESVEFSEKTIENMANSANLKMIPLKFWHPRQNWFAFHKDEFDTSNIQDGTIDWNRLQTNY